MLSRDSLTWAARIASGVVVLVIVAVLATLTVGTVSATKADEAAGAVSTTSHTKLPAFEAGDIISDDAFFDPNAMTESGIQAWLLAMPCAPTDSSPCLAFFRQTTTTRPANGNCLEYGGASNESGAEIVYKVAQACGISPRVLLVLVQKEQSLITRPSAYGYQRATGYACPDTAACNAKYFGFYNQVYSAAWQFREYTKAGDHWRVKPGKVKVQYSPDASCGASVVNIADQATADLYLYTPYQPDPATVAHPDGPGGACSAYGNLNFFRLYNTWFGNSRVERFPEWWGPCLDYVGGIACVRRN
jgi:hypothetical protein